MANYNRVQIGAVFLTNDGLVTGIPCRAQVSGIDGLQLTKTGLTTKSADGTPYNFVIDNTGQGVDIEIRPFIVSEAVLADIKAELETALSGSTTVNIVVSEGPFGDFDLECLPLFPRPVEFSGEFSADRISDVILRFTVVSINP